MADGLIALERETCREHINNVLQALEAEVVALHQARSVLGRGWDTAHYAAVMRQRDRLRIVKRRLDQLVAAVDVTPHISVEMLRSAML